MLIPGKELLNCFAKCNEITESYRLLCPQGGAHTLKSVELLIEAIKATLHGNLRIIELNELYSVAAARGAFLVDKDSNYTIVLMSGQNDCWSRLVLCKELFHVMLDSETSRNLNIAAHLEEYLASFPDTSSVPSRAVVSEWQAELAAMEFLLPYNDRAMILQRGNYVSSDIAKRYMIPRVFVERYLSSTYMDRLKPFSS